MKVMWRRLAALFSREPANWIRKRAVAALLDGSVPTGPVEPPPLRAQGTEPMRDSVANDTLSALALKYGLDLGDSAASRTVHPFDAMHPVVNVTARTVVLRADDARLVLTPDTARWLAHASLRAVLSPDGDLVAARDGVLVGAHLLNLPSGAAAVLISERGLFVLAEPCAIRALAGTARRGRTGCAGPAGAGDVRRGPSSGISSVRCGTNRLDPRIEE